jgi:hypothetical protein
MPVDAQIVGNRDQPRPERSAAQGLELLKSPAVIGAKLFAEMEKTVLRFFLIACVLAGDSNQDGRVAIQEGMPGLNVAGILKAFQQLLNG